MSKFKINDKVNISGTSLHGFITDTKMTVANYLLYRVVTVDCCRKECKDLFCQRFLGWYDSTELVSDDNQEGS